MEQSLKEGRRAMSEQPPGPQEIIIVRRNNGDGDGGHHGGAWKIAYADFVTAMMAFFLVMWLVNSANEVTKSRVASYFNPIKMTDSAASSRGLKVPTEKKSPKKPESDNADAGKDGDVKDKQEASIVSEEQLLNDPIAGLDKIALKTGSEPSGINEEIISRSAGDPFDPKAWEALRNGKPSGEEGFKSKSAADVDVSSTVLKQKTVDLAKDRRVEDLDFLRGTAIEKEFEKIETAASTYDVKDEQVVQLQTTLRSLVLKHKAELDISLNVRKTDEGLLIELGDNSGRGMFAIGSAVPSAGLVDIVGVVGKLLSEQPGDVIVSGHTDGRQFKSGRRDNWQLSTARAHMASYMLMRGGLSEARIKRIEGHGAATPLVTSNPLADANRRVEFLLKSSNTFP
jgi:chemotaxis protein MotB